MKRLITAVIIALAFATYAIQTVGQTSISTGGVIESQSGGFKFPDGSVQLSAVTPPCIAITYLPYTVIQEGVYCFTGNLETSMATGYAIDIQVDDVVIDLNGWKLDGLDAGLATQTVGIFASAQNNITIRNGTIQGFYRGVHLHDASPYDNSGGHLVENIRAHKNTYKGLHIIGYGSILRNNQVVDTGGTTSSSDHDAISIALWGYGGRVLENVINNTNAQGTGAAYGLRVFGCHGMVAEGNRIDNSNSDTGDTYGIYVTNSDDALVRNNSITNAANGVYFIGSTGKYMDNLTSGITTDEFVGGTAVGVNN